MYGRFMLHGTGEAVAEVFNVPQAQDLIPRFNIVPGQTFTVVRQKPPNKATPNNAKRAEVGKSTNSAFSASPLRKFG